MAQREPKQYPRLLNFLSGWKWSPDELAALLRGAERKLDETRQVWSATDSDDERARLHRRILSLASLIEDLRATLKRLGDALPEEPKPPDSPG